MFKHGGDNIGEKYRSRLWDVLRCASRRAFLGGFGGMLPREKKFKFCNLVRFGVYLYQILSLKNFKNCYFLYNFFVNYFFFIKSKYFRYTLASYGVILLKICLEAFHN